ncbi:MAG TPA: CoA-transferase [Anaerolineaceae bacterium]|jgi:glutaconate CoA-transferase subunit B|nr:CoA-transferase [Anaerolineaceae bacterium]HOU44857.1 CoA-transferase [Anaerolineaceae bacterium]HPA34058.1 CoA-transferase [Anaerolineaceae bacterium]HQF46151.1 CoA-transferase [Anaerolineaceae bacterium]HQH36083.1 CoA-transferase [Anaerolineaceae bacterium]
MTEYTLNELMAVNVARQLHDDEMGFIGVGTGGRAFTVAVGLPIVAARLAQLTHAPNFTIQIGTIISPDLENIPKVFTENHITTWPTMARVRADDNLDMFVKGKVDVGFVSGPQIDQYGNINITVIGDYKKPKVRLVGCLALPEHLAFARRAFVITDHNARTFVENVHFVTGVGWQANGKSREEYNLPGGGPVYVFTDLGVFDFNGEGHRMQALTLHPGVTPDMVQEKTGFPVIIPPNVPTSILPTEEEIELIRTKIDPENILLKY